MNKSSFTIALIIHLFFAFLLLVVAFFYFDPFNEFAIETDTVNMLNVGVFLPLVFSGTTIMVCFLLGLPLRLHSKMWNWWTSRPFLQLLLVTIGLLLLGLSNYQGLEINKSVLKNGEIVTRYYHNEYFSQPGWFLAAFAFIHLNVISIKEFILNRILGSSDWTRH